MRSRSGVRAQARNRLFQMMLRWISLVPPKMVEARQYRYCVERPTASGSAAAGNGLARSEEHTSELQSLMRISYAVFCLQKKSVTYCTVNLLLVRTSNHVNCLYLTAL